MSENLIGICGEATTYRDDFRGYRVKKIEGNDRQDRTNLKLKKTAIPVFAESHDTFQKLDYESRMPFDALWRPKEIVGTNLSDKFHRKSHREVNERFYSTRTKPVELVSPAVNLDDEKDPETRRLISNYLYKTTVTQAAEEVWRNFEKNINKRMDKINSEDSGDALRLNTKPIPVGFKNAAKKWDSLQSRRLIDGENLKEKHCKSHSAEANINLSEKLENRQTIGELIEGGKKLRLPYEKLPLAYGGHRTSIALGVPLLKKKLSPYNPDLTVSQALVS